MSLHFALFIWLSSSFPIRRGGQWTMELQIFNQGTSLQHRLMGSSLGILDLRRCLEVLAIEKAFSSNRHAKNTLTANWLYLSPILATEIPVITM